MNPLRPRILILLAMSAAFAGVRANNGDHDAALLDEIPVKWNEITVGYNSFRGSTSLSQYGRPSEGLDLHGLRLFAPATDRTPFVRLKMAGLSPRDNVVEGFVALNRGNTTLRGVRQQHSFYVLDRRPSDRSEDNVTEIVLDHTFSPSFGGFLSYRGTERDGRFPPPRLPNHVRTRTLSAGLGGVVLGGNFGVIATERRTVDQTGIQPVTHQRRIEAGFSKDIGPVNLEANAAYARITQSGRANSHIRSYALNGAYELGPATAVQVHFGQQDLDLGPVLNAHARKRFVASGRLVHRFPGWSFQLGFKHRETERIHADRSTIETPRVSEYDARLAGRIGPARLTLRGSWADLRDPATMDTLDPKPMAWDDRALFQARLEGGDARFSGYAAYTYRSQKNVDRGMRMRWQGVVLGGSYSFDPTLSGYAEFAADDFSFGHDAPRDIFFPSSRSFSLGLNWAPDERFSASVGFNYFESRDVLGSHLTMSLRRTLSPDHDLELIIAPWRLDDRAFNETGYRTTFLTARFTARF